MLTFLNQSVLLPASLEVVAEELSRLSSVEAKKGVRKRSSKEQLGSIPYAIQRG